MRIAGLFPHFAWRSMRATSAASGAG